MQTKDRAAQNQAKSDFLFYSFAEPVWPGF
jgi:hypothetical protein